MACPFFLPTLPLKSFSSETMPLGDLYGGDCAAEAGTLIADGLLRRGCNAGYARGSCPRAAQSDADAFRFLIKAHRDGVVDVAWSSERNHHPVAVGILAIGSIAGAPENGPLERQARAYAAAYLRQTDPRSQTNPRSQTRMERQTGD
jgi:hypothetical protein